MTDAPSNEVLAERVRNIDDKHDRNYDRLSASTNWLWRTIGVIAIGVIYDYLSSGGPGIG